VIQYCLVITMSIGDRIRKAREEKGWSQRELARQTGIHFNSINAWETGKREPTPVYIAVLEGVLQVSLQPHERTEHAKEEPVTASTEDGTVPAIEFDPTRGGEQRRESTCALTGLP